MKTRNVDAIVKENQELMQQIKANREKFEKSIEAVSTPKNEAASTAKNKVK